MMTSLRRRTYMVDIVDVLHSFAPEQNVSVAEAIDSFNSLSLLWL